MDQDPVEAVGADCANPALGEGVGVRRSDRGSDDFDAFGAEDLVEGMAEFRVAIVDQEPKRLLFAELHDEVARLLGRPAPVRIGVAGDVLDPPGRDRDEEQYVDPLEEGGLDGEEVAGDHARRLRPQERTP